VHHPEAFRSCTFLLFLFPYLSIVSIIVIGGTRKALGRIDRFASGNHRGHRRKRPFEPAGRANGAKRQVLGAQYGRSLLQRAAALAARA